MAGGDDRTHYEVLGVSSDASPRQIREAHRQMAMILHPDRQVDGSPAERRLADRRMKEVNAAWSVLSDPSTRADYDRSRRATTVGQSGSEDSKVRSNVAGADHAEAVAGDYVDDSLDRYSDDYSADHLDQEVPPWQYWMLRRGPLVAMLIVAAFLFIATAYAGSTRGDDPEGVTPTSTLKRECVSITSAGRSAVRVPCSSENDGRIVSRVKVALDCPRLTSYVVINEEFLCVSKDPSVVGSDTGD